MCKRLAGGRRVSCVVQSSTSLTTPPAPPSEPDLPVCGLTLYDFEGHEELYNIQSGLLSENSFVILTVNLKTLRDDPAKVERGAVWWLDAISKRRDIGKTLCVMLLGTFLDAVSATWSCAPLCAPVASNADVLSTHCLRRVASPRPHVRASPSSCSRW